MKTFSFLLQHSVKTTFSLLSHHSSVVPVTHKCWLEMRLCKLSKWPVAWERLDATPQLWVGGWEMHGWILENGNTDWCFSVCKLFAFEYIHVYYVWTVITDIYICWALLSLVFITNVCVINCILVLISNVPQTHLFILVVELLLQN